MENFNKPSKETVRAWLMERRLAHAPLPGIDRIRFDLGWPASQAYCAPTLRMAALDAVPMPELGARSGR